MQRLGQLECPGNLHCAGCRLDRLGQGSQLDPAQRLQPAGLRPGVVFDGQGGGTGWIVSNLGGIDFQAKVKWTYSVQADCRIVATHSFYINGNWSPPNKLVMVISGQNDRLKLKGIMAGAGPGFSVAQATALRLSMDYF